jgi:hypothetical protein
VQARADKGVKGVVWKAADVKGTSTGGYGKNAQGSSFSRQNQMGADNTAAVFDDEENEGRKTGYSTPGYLREGGVSSLVLAFQRDLSGSAWQTMRSWRDLLG